MILAFLQGHSWRFYLCERAEEIGGDCCGPPLKPNLQVLSKPSPYPYTPASTGSLNLKRKSDGSRGLMKPELKSKDFKEGQPDCWELEKYESAA